ncbi:MAG: SRPBCC domain-containing protein [Bacteroidota bacterium]
MALELKTSIKIEATPEQVWQQLLDFESYSEWNPFITEISGSAVVGERIKINAGGMKFTPVVLANRKNEEFRWLGSLLFKGLFDGEHRFLLEEDQTGNTILHHSEKFKGLLVPVFKKKLLQDTKENFQKMNEALKKRAEQRWN